ncbi:MAG TPA: amylo-alpha-1,6-glucosidase [Alphaproteobacteria bacterium]
MGTADRVAEVDQGSPFAISAPDTTPAYRPHVLKAGDTFLVVDPYGDIQATGPQAEGLFHTDTRFLSYLALSVNGHRLLLLSSNVTEDNLALVIDLTNPDMHFEGRHLARDAIHVLRTIVIEDGAYFETLQIRNYGCEPCAFALMLRFGADFADIFEVRGQTRPKRGRYLPEVLRPSEAVLRYQGLDGVRRETSFSFDIPPDDLTSRSASFRLSLGAGESRSLAFTVHCMPNGERRSRSTDFGQCWRNTQRRMKALRDQRAVIRSSNVSFNNWLNRSSADIEMLVTMTDTGPYPYAGIPWFSTAFGRDAIITALECLWFAPYLARGTLRFLAATQATELRPEMDAEPGKILHETRRGEMAILGEIPFGRYYGSVDATPLFVMLARAYFERTGDVRLIGDIWPNIEAALGWMTDYGDLDGDGFLEYDRRTPTGLVNQGWKDSSDSVFHADGRLGEPPIALCEVQSYAYAAWVGAAALARALGRNERANEFTARAINLRRRFEDAFWCDELGTYAIALDRDKRPCRVRSSNAGHTLLTGIASPERAAAVAATLTDPTSFSNWGIRTIATTEARYNPMSYHNGSIWPHDNALIALGFARYSLTEPLAKLVTGMFDAAMAVDLNRLPELFCGFDRRPGQGPTRYPVACLPQAWASGTVFALMGAMLGISFNPYMRQIRLTRPVLPAFLNEVEITGLTLGTASVDLLFRRHTRDVALNILRKEGDVEVIVVG